MEKHKKAIPGIPRKERIISLQEKVSSIVEMDFQRIIIIDECLFATD